MTTQESLIEAARLRLRVQMNNRLRLESIAALSKVFREFGEPIKDELLASVVFAIPEELLGEYAPMAEAAARRPTKRGPTRSKPPGKPNLPPVGKPRPVGKPSQPPVGKPSQPPVGKPSQPYPGKPPSKPPGKPPKKASSGRASKAKKR